MLSPAGGTVGFMEYSGSLKASVGEMIVHPFQVGVVQAIVESQGDALRICEDGNGRDNSCRFAQTDTAQGTS
jgi:hypothetical protein